MRCLDGEFNIATKFAIKCLTIFLDFQVGEAVGPGGLGQASQHYRSEVFWP